MDNDFRGLGCWSFVKLAGENQKQITIVMAYQPCKQKKHGNAIVNAQQQRFSANKTSSIHSLAPNGLKTSCYYFKPGKGKE
eukprot:836663-Ditylum_brightwellii.AAC.1